MEQDILEQLYFGKIVPWENRNDKTPEMEEISDRIDGEIERLKGMLDDEGKALLKKLLDDASELERRTVCEGFKDGFRLGTQIVAACLGSGKQP
ncbi:MAG: hypothetical protein K2P22_09685 [Lachnospiraceae bacterium]|nr:hypothetical protein [Lachnospiraceae bacterium]